LTPVCLATWKRRAQLAVHLTVSQLSQGIKLAEDVPFAANYHYFNCPANQGGLSKKGSGSLSVKVSPLAGKRKVRRSDFNTKTSAREKSKTDACRPRCNS